MSLKQFNLVVLNVFILRKFVVTMKRHGDGKFIVIYNDRVRWQHMCCYSETVSLPLRTATR